MDAQKIPFLVTFFILMVGASDYNYSKVLELSLLFYEAQRSGHLTSNNRIQWRGDSGLQDLGENGEDLTGGYYDAGDYVKFGFPMAYTVTVLSWGLLSAKDAYIQAEQYEKCLDAIRWAAEYFIKCHVDRHVLYGQVGSFSVDHNFWGRPEDMNMTRPAYKIDPQHPGSDLAGEMAAALAATSIVFEKHDDKFAASCLDHSMQLYDFALKYKGLFHESLTEASFYYQSTGYGDELAWSAAWLYKATNDKRYLADAEEYYIEYNLDERPKDFYYDKKNAGVQILLAQITKKKSYLDAAESFCSYASEEQKKTPKGLIYMDKFGTLCHAASMAFICLQVAELGAPGASSFQQLAKSQIHYMLGDSGRSYVVGFGKDPPLQPHHAASSCPDRPAVCDWDAFNSPAPNPHILYGALVAGPDENDYFQDVRRLYIYGEVACDCNAAFQGAVAMLKRNYTYKTENPNKPSPLDLYRT